MSEANLQHKRLKTLALVMMIISFVGFIDATYLTITHYTQANVPCTLTHGCDYVLKSKYSEVFGIPVSSFGSLYYLVILLLSYGYLEFKSRWYFKLTGFLTIVGVLASSWFVYVQIGILNKICQYCMLSALTSTLLFGLGMWVVKTVGSSRLSSASDQE